MWWVSFSDGTAIIIEASSLAHARLLAVVHQFGRAAQFVDCCLLSPELVALIPDDFVGRLFSRNEALRLYERVKHELAALHACSEPRRVVGIVGQTFRRLFGACQNA